MDGEKNQMPAPMGAKYFATTHWSVVWRARDGEPQETQEALGALYRSYAPPLLAYLRRAAYSESDAEDLLQEFFLRLIDKRLLDHLSHQGRFRSFLLVLLKNFLLEQRGRARAQKRGGGQILLSLEQLSAEGKYLCEPVDHLTPEQVFERRWAQSLMQRSIERLQTEYETSGRGELFKHLAEYQPRQAGSLSYGEIGARLNTTESALKSAMLRLRQRHREILREEVGQTVGPEALEEELRYLRSVLAQGHVGE